MLHFNNCFKNQRVMFLNGENEYCCDGSNMVCVQLILTEFNDKCYTKNYCPVSKQ